MKKSLFNLHKRFIFSFPPSLCLSLWIQLSFVALSTAARPSTQRASLSLPHVHSKGQVTREKKWRRSNTQQLSVWGTGDEWQHVCHCIMSGALSALSNCLHAPRCAQAQWRFTLTPIRQHIGSSSVRCGRPEMPLSVGIPLGTPGCLFFSHLYWVNETRSWQCVSICALFWQEGKSPMSTAARLKRWIHYFCLD